MDVFMISAHLALELHFDKPMTCPLCTADCRSMPTHPEAELFRCVSCSHAFTRPDSIRFPEQYEQSYFEEEHRRWFEHPNIQLFEQILSEIPQGASVADIGCGRGDFLRFAHSKRPDLNTVGIDLSPNSDEPGIHFIQGDILNLNIETRFDVVVSLAVIEHIAQVQEFLLKMQQLAKPSGTIIVMTLNDDSLLYTAGRLGRRVGVPLAFNRLYSAHHLHHFTRASLATLLRNNGCLVRRHLDHNAPIEAMDIPVSNKWLDAVLRNGLRVLWMAGRLTQRSYLQTIIGTVPVAQPEETHRLHLMN
jgi:2-polyprenyl-3-methyl-5-hydroxy-6-metoxy-1,4-benzoquinol methylase